MTAISYLAGLLALGAPSLMLALAIWLRMRTDSPARRWRLFVGWSSVASLFLTAPLVLILYGGAAATTPSPLSPYLAPTPFGAALAVLVQLLGTVIAAFSARYLQGEERQTSFVTALAEVLCAVHLLILADHWLVLIGAWCFAGWSLERLLCFYPDRPFAQLAAYKKRLADGLATFLLIAAACLAWRETGSGSLTTLFGYVAKHGTSTALALCAALLVIAIVVRTALLPMHGWLIQVMEAPTPVSALLHAGVVNLGGFWLIRLSPLIDQLMWLRTVLVCWGLITAALGGLVMLTRVSIKVRLAWSTVSQMGFMVMECGLGLYSLAFLHMVGHSLYKAHQFLAAGSIVRQTRIEQFWPSDLPDAASVLVAPFLSVIVVAAVQVPLAMHGWPWWWTALIGVGWAPLLWLPNARANAMAIRMRSLIQGIGSIGGLAMAAALWHRLSLAPQDMTDDVLGMVAAVGMLLLYAAVALLRLRPHAMERWRRWSYAGYYVDEYFTRLAIALWPSGWRLGERATTAEVPTRYVAANAR